MLSNQSIKEDSKTYLRWLLISAIVGAIAFVFLVRTMDSDPPAPEERAQSEAMVTQLETVERGDFVEFDGRLYVVLNTYVEDYLALGTLGNVGDPLHLYFRDGMALRVTDIIRESDSRWCAAAKLFLR